MQNVSYQIEFTFFIKYVSFSSLCTTEFWFDNMYFVKKISQQSYTTANTQGNLRISYSFQGLLNWKKLWDKNNLQWYQSQRKKEVSITFKVWVMKGQLMGGIWILKINHWLKVLVLSCWYDCDYPWMNPNYVCNTCITSVPWFLWKFLININKNALFAHNNS